MALNLTSTLRDSFEQAITIGQIVDYALFIKEKPSYYKI